MTIFANTLPDVVLTDVVLTGEGKLAQTDVRTLPIAGWRAEGHRLEPLSFAAPRPGALVLVRQGDHYYSLDGVAFPDWKTAIAPLWDAAPKPTEAPAPALTVPGVGAPLNTWQPKPTHRQHDAQHPRDLIGTRDEDFQ